MNSVDSISNAGSILDVPGIRAGHFNDQRRPTGCTVVLIEAGAVGGVDVRGSAPGTRETDLLNPINTVEKIHAVLLSGGSAFGLEAASGVVRYLEERQIGFDVGVARIPIVSAAVLFDLAVGDASIRPDAVSGYRACQNSSSTRLEEGSVGAGAGATVGKMFGMNRAMKSGIGQASLRFGPFVVAALMAVNAFGDVVNPANGQLLAGARTTDGKSLANSIQQLQAGHGHFSFSDAAGNTTIGVVATNARLSKPETTKLAQMAQDGLARSINPVHTPVDGDTLFALATGSVEGPANLTRIGSLAAEAVSRAICRAVLMAKGRPGIPSHRDMIAD